MKELDKTYWDALYFTRNKRPIVCPNMGFARQLQEYEKIIKQKKTQAELNESPTKPTYSRAVSTSP